MKIVSPQIIHKSEAGGVKVGLRSADEVVAAFDEIVANARRYDPKATVEGVLVAEMIEGGKEMIIGAKEEPGVGPVLMLGMGGIYVEVLKDVTFRLAPVTDQDVQHMIHSIKTRKILEGIRGERPSDVAKLAECIQRLSQLVEDFAEIRELDINPLRVMEEGQGCKVLDVRIGLGG
jgi:4-hydroxybutyryl-CoA synthetase (ADP-forming)